MVRRVVGFLAMLFVLPLLAVPFLPPSQTVAGPGDGVFTSTKKPFLREEYFYSQRAAPGTQVPPGALLAARLEAAAGISTGATPPVVPGETSFVGDPPGAWTPLGPQPISETVQRFAHGQPPNSGRVTSVAVQDANTVYVGAASGGVWKTTDAGVTWSPLTDTQPSLAIGALALDPNNANVIYAGLGEQFTYVETYYGFGVLKSVDAGASWTLSSPAFLKGQRIGRIAVDPRNSTTVYAASTNGLARSTDGGVTWTQQFLGTGGSVTDVVVDATTIPSTVYAANGWIGGSADNGVYMSTNGTAWTKLPGSGAGPFPVVDVGRVRLSITNVAPVTLYAVVHKVPGHGLLGVWKTADGGATWAPTAHPETSAGAAGFAICSQCFYDLNISVYPSNPNIVYVLTVELYRSSDGGATWSLVSFGYTGPPYKVHVDQHSLAFIPGNPNGFYLGNDGGVYRSLDSGANFANLNQSLSITQFYRGAAGPINPLSAYGGTQDNGSLSYEGAPAWHGSVGGDGGYAAIDFDLPHIVYSTTQNLGLSRSISGPRGSFRPASNGLPTEQAEKRQFIAPIVMDPTNPKVLYAGATKLYRTSDNADTWTAVSPDLSSNPASGRNAISAIGLAPSAPGTVYVGTGSSSAAAPAKLWVSTTAGAPWTDRTAGLPNRFITSIAVHPMDSNTAYVTVSGFDAGHVWKTTNGGGAWADVSGALPNGPVNSIVVHPSNGLLLYIGTDVGVYRSTNGAVSWSAMSSGLPNVVIHDLVLSRSGASLFAFSHGRGAFRMDLSNANAPARLAFITSQPVEVAGGIFAAPPAVVVQDANGILVPTATNPVTLAVSAGPVGGSLQCLATTVAAVGGVAKFPGCRVSQAGPGYTLTASSGALTPATTLAFSATALAEGSIDPSFGFRGKATADGSGQGYNNDSAYAVALQPDGKIVVAGEAYTGSAFDFAVTRFNPDGAGPDLSFGDKGRVTTDFGGGYDRANAVARQADGKIVVAGVATVAGARRFALARFTASGALDPGFGTGGKLLVDFGTDDWASAVAVQPDGKIVAAGFAKVSDLYKFAVARYLVDGTLDPGFGAGGKVTTTIAFGHDFANAMALQTDGKIVVAGYGWDGFTSYDFALARYHPDGTLDASFDGDGKALTDLTGGHDLAYAVTVQADGKIVAAGYAPTSTTAGAPRHWAVARYHTNGTLDTSFDTDGKVVTQFAGCCNDARAVAVQSDGKVIVAGHTGNMNAQNQEVPQWLMQRYNANGMLDASFGNGGVVSSPFGAAGNDAAYAVAVQSNGRILVAGKDPLDFALARFTGSAPLAGPASKLAITQIAPASPNPAPGAFSVTVQSQDANGNPAGVTAATAVQLSLKTGTGVLGGTLAGSIGAGADFVTINGVTYSQVGNGIILTATRTGGDTLTAGDSAPFNVMAPPVPPAKLAITGLTPASPTAGQPFTVIVQAQDTTGAPANVTAATMIHLTRQTGTGVLAGTLTGSIAAGTNMVTIQGVTYTPAETGVVLRADDDATPNEATETGLMPGNSAAFNVLAAPAGPVVKADYRFQDMLTSSVGTPPALANLGLTTFADGVVDGTNRRVLSFAANDGVALSPTTGVVPNDTYTVVALFSFTDITSYRRILDFKNGASDLGLYSVGGALHFYNGATPSATPMAADTFMQVVLTRDAAKNLVGYVNGVQQFAFTDTNDFGLIDANNTLRFFRDNELGGSIGEASAGSVARIRLYDTALTGEQVAALDRLPVIGPPPPAKLAITNITPASPTAGQPFSVTVQAQDTTGAPANVAAATTVHLTRKTGTGTLAPAAPQGTIAVGTNSVTITGLTYTPAEAGVVLRADDDATPIETTETGLMPGDSAAFNVMAPPPAKLAITQITPVSPTAGQAFSVMVQAQDASGAPANVAAATMVHLSRKTGTGVLGGTLIGTIAAGTNSVTITGVTYTPAETGVVLRADDDATPIETTETGLMPGDSAPFNVVDAPPPPAAKLAITQITPASPTAGQAFAVTMQAQDSTGAPANVAAATNVTLSKKTGTGTLGGTMAGTIAAGTNAVTINGVTYSQADTGVVLTAARTSGDTLTAGDSAPFTVMATPPPPATKLAITQIVPVSPTAGQAFAVTVQAQDSTGAPANVAAATSVTLSKKTGTGTLGGTMTGTIAAGTNAVIISGVTYSQTDTSVALTATRTGGDALTPGDSAPFNVIAGATTVTSQGVALIGADSLHSAGIRGQGLKIAVLTDTGFSGVQERLGTELPVNTVGRSYHSGGITGGGATLGTMVAEVVHDMAPGAQLYLVNYDPGIGSLEFGNILGYLGNEGVLIIALANVLSLDGLISDQIAHDVATRGSFWAVPAGDLARRHWRGTWSDPDGDSWLNFTATDEGNRLVAAAGDIIQVALEWNDDPRRSCNDYNLYLANEQGTIVAASTEYQQCGPVNDDPPTERIVYTAPTAGTYQVAVSRYNAASTNFVFTIVASHLLSHIVPEGTLVSPAHNPNVMTAGAVAWNTPTVIEPDSSRGLPGVVPIKPDIVGPDAVATSFGQFPSLLGTLAATAHVAGGAALVAQANPTFTQAQIKAYLEGRAVDLGAPGKDTIFGAGRLSLPAATPPAAGALQFSAATYSVNENGGTATVTVTRTGGSAGVVGATAATVAGGSATAGADYTTTSVSVSFADGDTAAKSVTVPILEDTLVEGNETVHLALSNPMGGATLGAQSTAVLTIVDNDSPPPAATKLAITQITPASPTASQAFAVTVQAQDSTGAPANVAAATPVNLTLKTGAGTLGGTLMGTMPAGTNVVIINGVTYSVAGNGVVLRADDDVYPDETAGAETGLMPGDSAPFNVVSACGPYDVNCDGAVSSTDALCVRRNVNGLPATTACPDTSHFDANRDGAVSSTDALCVRRKVNGLGPTTACPTFNAFVKQLEALSLAGDPSGRPEDGARWLMAEDALVQLAVSPSGAELTPTPASAAPGQAVVVTLSMTAPAGGNVGAWIIDTTYDPNVVTVTCTNLAAGSLCNPNYLNTNNKIRVNGDAFPGFTGTTNLASITLTAKTTATPGTTMPLTMTLTEFANDLGSPISGAVAMSGSLNIVPPPPARLAITNVNPASPNAAPGTFAVTVQAQDASGAPANVAAATPVHLSVKTGTGVLGGPAAPQGSIAAATNSIVINGLTYSKPEIGVVLRADDDVTPNEATETGLLPGDSAPFNVVAQAATTLAPTSGPPLTSVTITGGGFVANESLMIHWDGPGHGTTACDPAGTMLTQATASATGGVSVTITVPSCASVGNHNVLAVGAQTAVAVFGVTSPPPTKLAVTQITPASPTAGQGFSVTVQARDANDAPANVAAATLVYLSRQTGTGTLGGTLTATIAAATNSVNISGVTYSPAENGVVLRADDDATPNEATETGLLPGDSATFNVAASTAAAGAAISPSSANVAPGGSVTLTLSMTAPAGGNVGAWIIDITYNPNVVTVTCTTLAAGSLCNANFGGTNNKIRVNGDAVPGLTGTTNLASITVTASATATPGTTMPLTMTLTEFVDDLGAPISGAVATSGSITIEGTPLARLAITQINPASPNLAPSTFSVTVQSQDASGTAANVVQATGVSLSVKTGTGTLAGTISGSIAAGTNAVTISGVTYSPAESGVVLTATRTSGDILAAGDSAPFNVGVPGILQFSAANYSVNENGGSATITVTRTGGGNGAVGVTAATMAGGTANAGSDYTATSVTISFASGDTTPKAFAIPTFDDSLVEGNETVLLGLSNPTGGATLGTQSTAVLVIIDNDAVVPSITLNPTSGPPGAGVNVTGGGFVANENVMIHWDGAGHGTTPCDPAGTMLVQTAASGAGAINVTIIIPACASLGNHNVLAVGAQTATAVFSVTTTTTAAVRIDLDPQTANVGVNGMVELAIRVHSGTQIVDGVETFLTFNSAFLEVVDADTTTTGVQLGVQLIPGGCALPTMIKNEADNTNGTIHLSRGVDTASPQPISGDCTLGIVRFKGKAENTGGTPVVFLLPPAFPATKATLNGNPLRITTTDGMVHVVPIVLTFISQPVKGAHGFKLGIQPVIAVQEGGTTRASDNSTVVTLGIRPGTGASGATLTCAGVLSKTVSAGVAAFTDCTIDLKGQGYVLEATAASAGPGATPPFNVIWAGDANNDCLVDIVDFSVLVHRFGKHLGDPGYDPRADINGDNMVDILDFSIFVTLFGTRCPALALAPASGADGTVVTVTGSAFVAHREVSITLDGTAVASTPITVMAGGSGNFTASFTVPVGTAAGARTVKASQMNGRVVVAAIFTRE